jgi:hypothetical protein
VAFVVDKFQPDFYVTCATVIPVLFLAFAVQGQGYRSMIRAARKVNRGYNLWRRGAHPRRERAWRWLRARPWSLVAGLGAAIVGAGFLGEYFALLALFQRSEIYTQRVGVFVATILLAVAVTVGPMWIGVNPDQLFESGADQPTEDGRRGTKVAAQGSSIRPHYDA